MLSGKVKFLTHTVEKAVFLLSLLTVGCGRAEPSCASRRCLAKMLIKKDHLSQPQNENCTQPVYVPILEYQTLEVDTRNLRLITRLQATLVWSDDEMGWNTSVYEFDKVVLPINKVWTPELHVTNGIETSMQHSSHNLLVYSNGTMMHSVIINAEVDCEVNLFNYPFATDECPVAIHTWSTDGCGTDLTLGGLKVVDGAHGDWRTTSAVYAKRGDDRNYIYVELSINPANPFITLLLPSILIILADMVSSALPLGGGERNCFKVTLVLSFTMFLNILNNLLPGGSTCSPIIRVHFCVCLCLLVLSMLVSMVLTRIDQDGPLISCCWSKGSGNKQEKEDAEAKVDVSVIQPTASEENIEMLKKVVKFLESLDTKERERERHQTFATTADKIFFWFYTIFGTAYFCAMITVIVKYKCSVDHFDFWSN